MIHTLFLIDDHKVVKDGIRALLLARPDIRIVGDASSGAEAIVKIAELKPDLAFVDLKLPDMRGSELIGKLQLQCPDTRFAILTADPNAHDLKKAQSAGAMGFLTKDMNDVEYFQALDKMIAGKRYISAAFSETLINAEEAYTPREIEVLQGFSDGLSYKEIGAKLDISPRTVETHKNSLLEKMQVKSIVEMVRKAIRDGYIKA